MDKPYFYSENPIDFADTGKWLPFENMLCQLFTDRMEKYTKSNFKNEFRYVIAGQWTLDLKDSVLMLTKDRSNTTMHRKVIRGDNNTQRRRAEDNIRFGG